MAKIIMTPGGTPKGDRPLAYVPYEMQNAQRLCRTCKYSKREYDSYDRVEFRLCTIDKPMRKEDCDGYEPR